MSDLIGTRWIENDKRFVRIVEVVAHSGGTTPRIGRRTVSMDGKPGHPTRVTYGEAAKFFRGFRQQAAMSTETTPRYEAEGGVKPQ